MGGLVNTIWRAMILDDTAYHAWRERENLFLRGIVLVLIVSLVSGLLGFAWTFVQGVRPVDEASIRQDMREAFSWQNELNPAWQDPVMREMMDDVMDQIMPMVLDIATNQAPLPRAFGGFFEALGSWLSGGLAALGVWLLYGVLVLIVAHWLGGSDTLQGFLGTVALYSVPGLLGLLGPIPCLGPVLVFAGFVWGIIVYIKATSVATGLDGWRSTVAVLAPAAVLLLLVILVAILILMWFIVIV